MPNELERCLTQLRLIATRFAADLALERLFASMHPLMVVQLTLGLEYFSAVAAFERSIWVESVIGCYLMGSHRYVHSECVKTCLMSLWVSLSGSPIRPHPSQ